MENKALSLIVKEVEQLESMLLESGGEITDEIENLLTINNVQLAGKVDSYSIIMDRFDGIESFYKEKADQYIKMAKAAAQVSERLKTNLKDAMTVMGVSELDGFDIRYKLCATKPRVVIEEPEKIDQAYTREKVEKVIDKERIAEDLKLGFPVTGARLEQSFSLRKYLAKKAVRS